MSNHDLDNLIEDKPDKDKKVMTDRKSSRKKFICSPFFIEFQLKKKSLLSLQKIHENLDFILKCCVVIVNLWFVVLRRSLGLWALLFH